MFRRILVSGLMCLTAVVLAGCATEAPLTWKMPAHLIGKTELSATPFFPQEDYQCGPAALGMSLNATGIKADPEVLVSQVYLPKRRGSLQIEMLATARRQGAMAIVIPASMEALLTEVASGNPVIVLQNLGLGWIPMWHYAVVIGYDLSKKEIILRSGTTERLVMPLVTFERTWARSDRWAMVTLMPGRLPKTASMETIITALVAFERDNQGVAVYQAYHSALLQWPKNLTLLIGAGNAAFSMGRYNVAAMYFESAITHHPTSAPALNNLALTYAHLDEYDRARETALKAISLGDQWRPVVAETLRTIDSLQRSSAKGLAP
jgi:hypothetical protein